MTSPRKWAMLAGLEGLRQSGPQPRTRVSGPTRNTSSCNARFTMAESSTLRRRPRHVTSPPVHHGVMRFGGSISNTNRWDECKTCGWKCRPPQPFIGARINGMQRTIATRVTRGWDRTMSICLPAGLAIGDTVQFTFYWRTRVDGKREKFEVTVQDLPQYNRATTSPA